MASRHPRGLSSVRGESNGAVMRLTSRSARHSSVPRWRADCCLSSATNLGRGAFVARNPATPDNPMLACDIHRQRFAINHGWLLISQRERSRGDCIRIAASRQAMGWAILCAASRGSAHCNSLPPETGTFAVPHGAL
jgi:hypothetical protein